jgi:hypothetical protein
MSMNTKKEAKGTAGKGTAGSPVPGIPSRRWARYGERLINPPPSAPAQVSDGWIKRYTFSLGQGLVLGCAEAISMTDNPLVDFHADRFFTNAPFRSFAILHNIVFANISITIGGGEDAFHYQRVRSLDNPLTFPMVTPASRIGVMGSYTGRRSKLYADGPFRFVATFQGKARDIS